MCPSIHKVRTCACGHFRWPCVLDKHCRHAHGGVTRTFTHLYSHKHTLASHAVTVVDAGRFGFLSRSFVA